MFLETFLYWLFIFFLFNVIGWFMESVIESVSHKRLINRGFLTGPYIPIYGFGGILFALVGLPLKDASPRMYVNIFLVFFVGMSLATLLEYMVGSFLERVFKKQFWDYSMLKLTYKFTYKNRISLVSSLFWGLLSLFMSYFLYDRVSDFVSSLHLYLIVAVNISMTLIIGTDTIIQIKRHENIQRFLEKMTYEQLRDALHKSLLRMGGAQQIREFRDAVFKNINVNLKNNIKKNIETIRKLTEKHEPQEMEGEDDEGKEAQT
ncbi:MAG: putative ABC transporter permease [Oscillospiraceae bacterium]|nr:putative ABC transporter permease [Oscillospiraceae bacterium]